VSEKSEKHRQLLVNIAFDSNRLEKESMMSAYELVLPFAEKSSVQPRKKAAKRRDNVHREQLRIAL
jgi:hypothetical protein